MVVFFCMIGCHVRDSFAPGPNHLVCFLLRFSICRGDFRGDEANLGHIHTIIFFDIFKILVEIFVGVRQILGTAKIHFFPADPQESVMEIIQTIRPNFVVCYPIIFYFFPPPVFSSLDRGFRSDHFIRRRAHPFFCRSIFNILKENFSALTHFTGVLMFPRIFNILKDHVSALYAFILPTS